MARGLAHGLPLAGWDVTLASGSLGSPGERSHAETFYGGLDVVPLDYTPALGAVDPLASDLPFQPSYEDRAGAPDQLFARVSDGPYERLVKAWSMKLTEADAARAALLHLHHLTPIHEAAAREFPSLPVISQLHGTEMLMLERISGGSCDWPHAQAWAERMRRWASSSTALIVLSADAIRRVPHLLGVDTGKLVLVPNGFDPAVFRRSRLDHASRLRFWRRWLVDDPQGQDESGIPGSVRYAASDIEAFAAGPVLLYVGRFTSMKRVPLLVRAHARMQARLPSRVPLVLVGGYPGEVEGEHPLAAARIVGDDGVFLAGWRTQEELATALNAADALVLPSVREEFGQVLIEAMASGLPVIATDTHGPATIVEPSRTGWLVPPNDEEALAEALLDAAVNAGRRRRMGNLAHIVAHERYSLSAVVGRVAKLYDDVCS